MIQAGLLIGLGEGANINQHNGIRTSYFFPWKSRPGYFFVVTHVIVYLYYAGVEYSSLLHLTRYVPSYQFQWTGTIKLKASTTGTPCWGTFYLELV